MTGSPLIAVVPYGIKRRGRLAAIALDQLHWPLGSPELAPGSTIANLGPDDHLIVYLGSWLFFGSLAGVRARLSVVVGEPEAFHGRYMRLLRWLHRRFFRILTCNARLLQTTPNAVFFSCGNTWVPEWETLDCSKTRMLSIIASAKASLVGHKLRHETVHWLRHAGVDVEIMGGGYRWFEQKSEGLAAYRYSIVIENSRERGYFTEKLIDALLCETVPIYWGAPDIAEFFDVRGMIACQSLDEIKAAVAMLSAADYESRREAIANNRSRAANYAHYERNAAQCVLDEWTAAPQRAMS
ncbi:glycosyltransferase family 10 [Devosia sp.]|uniref:glycosyltransferase family 10 domain-containing protein n=1 Tax=Devosia sp. TaxID=1871048 RepID=UPI002601D704|nr:glycosyltransferase family 10 [Devosia sp.]